MTIQLHSFTHKSWTENPFNITFHWISNHLSTQWYNTIYWHRKLSRWFILL